MRPLKSCARFALLTEQIAGVLDTLFGEPLYLFGAHEEDRLKGAPGEMLATRFGAVCVGTTDGAIWITHLRAKMDGAIKLPATQVLGKRVEDIPESPMAFDAVADYRSLREIRYVQRNEIGYLYFDFYNGAMDPGQCRRLREAYRAARAHAPRVIALMGGRDFFCNGINLNTIEAADSPADESWRSVRSLDDFVLEVLNTMSHLTIAALRGNAGAGGALMALAADRVYARSGVVLNPHYRGMGGLYGSEYWTYTLPRRVGQDMALQLTQGCAPLAHARRKRSASSTTPSARMSGTSRRESAGARRLWRSIRASRTCSRRSRNDALPMSARSRSPFIGGKTSRKCGSTSMTRTRLIMKHAAASSIKARRRTRVADQPEQMPHATIRLSQRLRRVCAGGDGRVLQSQPSRTILTLVQIRSGLEGLRGGLKVGPA